MPLASAQLRDAIHSANPARATLTAIVAFHGLRSGQPRKLQLTDIHDGRLHMDQRTIPLAPERAATPPSWLTRASKKVACTTSTAYCRSREVLGGVVAVRHPGNADQHWLAQGLAGTLGGPDGSSEFP